ncbi:MAG: helix-turn-helix domain-containing protein, partial [Coriobacteriales bacterium]|nr:helix-turn-helix domain-containing protein [Coriobacteriales bacterium]
MRISGELAQPIVDRLENVISVPINIIDEDGTIVASTERSRVGSFHQGGIIVRQQQDELRVDQSVTQELSGTRAGITMPLTLNGEFIGALGVTGEPGEIEEMAHIVRVAVLSLTEQAYHAQMSQNKSRVHDNWASRLVADRLGDETVIAEQARSFGIDLDRSCSIILIQTRPAAHVDFTFNERAVMQAIRSYGSLQFNAYVGQGRYLFAVQAREGTDDVWLTRLCTTLCGMLEASQEDCWIGVGRPGCGIRGYRRSFFDAMQSVHIMERLKINKRVLFHYEHRFFRLLEYIPQQARETFCDSYLHRPAMDPLIAATLAAYFEADCSPARAAEALHIHRNTLNY